MRFVNEISKRIWALMVSRKLAVWLLGTVVLMLAVGAFLPNPSLLPEDYRVELKKTKPLIYYLGEKFNSEKLAQGYLFGFIGVFLIVSTTACSVDRLLKWKRTKPSGEIPDEVFQKKGVSVVLKHPNFSDLMNVIEEFLRNLRMKVIKKEGIMIGYRGEIGFWGSIFFHGILITALFGLVIYYLGGYRALLVIGEGQTLRLSEKAFYYVDKKPIWGLPVPDAIIKLNSVTTVYAPEDPWSAIDHIVNLTVNDLNTGIKTNQVLKINKPIKIGGKLFLLEAGGYSPMVIITSKNKRLFHKYVNLRSEGGRKDYFFVDDLRLDIRFFPDFYLKDGIPSTRTPQVKNPFFEVVLTKGNRFLKRELIPLGGTLKTGSYTVHIPELRRWVMLKMVGEPGVGFFFWVSVLGIFAELVRFLDPDERLYIRFRDGHLEIYPYSRYFTGLLKERVMEFVGSLKEEEG